MKKIFILTFIFFTIFMGKTVYAGESEDILSTQMESLDFDNVISAIDKSDTAFKVDFYDLVTKAITGEIDLTIKDIGEIILQMIFSEIFQNTNIIKELIIIAILSALLKNLTASFENQAAGEMGFYISYIALIMVLLSSFKLALSILETLVYQVSDFAIASVPLMVSLIVMGGNITGGYAFSGVLVFSINLIVTIIKVFVMPSIMIIATINIINYLTENETLTNLSKLLKDIITWVVKIISMGFMGVLTLQRISSPILNNLAVKTAKSTVNAVPVVGDILAGAVDSVLFWSEACKSGVSVAILISVLAVCLVPIIKLGVFILIYKVTAALIQPICDKRIVACINVMGDYTSLMLSSGVIVVFMFIFSVMIMLSF